MAKKIKVSEPKRKSEGSFGSVHHDHTNLPFPEEGRKGFQVHLSLEEGLNKTPTFAATSFVGTESTGSSLTAFQGKERSLGRVPPSKQNHADAWNLEEAVVANTKRQRP